MTSKCSPQDAVNILKFMSMRYAPRPMPWSDPNASEQTRTQTMTLWTETMRNYSQQSVLAACQQICEAQPDWSPNLNQFTRAIQIEARAEQLELTRTRRLESATRCDGSGYIITDDGCRPCATCNAFLYSEWQNGTWNDARTEARQQRAERFLNETGGLAQPCQPSVYDNHDQVFSPKTGLAYAIEGYSEHAVEQGREANPNVVNKWLRFIETR